MEGKTILLDPWFDGTPKQMTRLVPPAISEDKIRACDLIFISHEHFDHCSPFDVNSIVQRTYAHVVAPEESMALLNIPTRSKVSANAGETFTFHGIDVEVVEARHPQSVNPVGYIIRGEGKSVYFAGDTYEYYGMSEYDVDVALLPIGGTICMDPIAALKAVKTMKAKYVVPMSYDTFTQLKQEPRDFAARVKASTKTSPVVLKLGEGFDI
jgi:L-ascorbate metabolism protein UlaG (beta-lactamase superfamily)